VQVNVEIKTVLGGSPRINITDVLKPADDDDEEDVKPAVGMCHCSVLFRHDHTQPFTALLDFVRDPQVSQHQKGKTNLDLLEQEIVSGSGISWATCKSAP